MTLSDWMKKSDFGKTMRRLSRARRMIQEKYDHDVRDPARRTPVTASAGTQEE